MKPTAREVPAKVRRTGLHTLTLELGGQHFTGHVAEFAQLASEIRLALQQNGID
ncbi:MAG: hypothetical protein INR66_13055 [Gordonia polyisoprenivorans]|nr:hypothetical protein [Gordonia polyisoprenivorans]